jgi:dephospho-CoA kinase
MLRVGLTGGLGSGKSTVAEMLRELGAQVIEADALGRSMMEPGQPVYEQVVRSFGPEVVSADGKLNRARLAEIAFTGGRLNELNGIVHPAVIAVQQKWMEQVFARDASAVAVVESALIFEVVRDAKLRGEADGFLADWRKRIDRIVVVTAPDPVKIERYVTRVCPDGSGRAAAVTDARKRLAHQIPDAEKAAQADYVIDNSRSPAELREQVEAVWQKLKTESNKSSKTRSLQ